jgi:hypothetical protein
MFTLWVGLENEGDATAGETAVLATSEISATVVSMERAAELMIAQGQDGIKKILEGSISVCSNYHEE